MANTKVFLIVILFTATLISFFEVSARELAGGSPQSTRQTQSVEESKQYGYGGDGPIGYGNPRDGGDGPIGYGNPRDGGDGPRGYGNPRGCRFRRDCFPPNQPSRQKKAKVVEEKRD